MHPRRVLHVFEPPDGGVAENVAQLGRHLPSHGWETVIAGPAESTAYGRLRSDGVRIEKVSLTRGIAHPWADVSALHSLLKLLKAEDFDLVHAHSSKAGALARIAAHHHGIPVVFSPHCFAFVGEISAARRIITTRLEKLLGRWSNGIICVCEEERRNALRLGIASPDRLFRVHNGVETCQAIGQPDPTIARIRERGPVVGTIAVLRRQKRIDRLVDAAPVILDAVPDAQVVIVGNGPEREALRDRAGMLGLADHPRFRFIDFSGSSEKYLVGLDLFVLSSGWEALPIGVLEAMACGVPQVATDVGGTGEAVADHNTGLLVEPKTDAIAGAVVGLLRNPDIRAAMAQASRERQREFFSIDEMVRATVRVYDTVTAWATPVDRQGPEPSAM